MLRLIAALAIVGAGSVLTLTARAAANAASTTASVSVEKVMPAEVLVGRTFEFVIKVTNLGDGELQDVLLTDSTEGGARIEEATPKADQVNGKESTWRLGNLGARQSREVRVRAVAIDETPITGCANATFRPGVCATTQVVRPAIELVKTLPADALLCDPIPVKLVVKNSGSSVLNNVKITDNLPEGLRSDSGEGTKSFEVGRLNPGQSREVTFAAKAARPGQFVNKAQVTSAEGAEATAEATVNVLQPVLAVNCQTPVLRTIAGIPEGFAQFLGRPFDVCWEISNTGNAPSANSTVEVVVPAGVVVRSATDGGSVSGGRLVWNLGSLAAGASRKVCATWVAASAGSYEFQASVAGGCAAPVQTRCSVPIQGVNAVLVELVDDPDPIQVGEQTTYTIRVTNQGGGLDLHDVAVQAVFPEGLDPVAASNAGQVNGKSVKWAPVASIPLRQSVTYTVTGRGKSAGDHRVEVQVTTRARQLPIAEVESTTVY
jgi:uncharacterized repeat protein (TIGR01451 family)